MDTIDTYVGETVFLTGTISDFGKIPSEIRDNILKTEYDLIIRDFAEPIGRVLSLYPECPAAWLIPERWRQQNRVDSDVELSKLSNACYTDFILRKMITVVYCECFHFKEL